MCKIEGLRTTSTFDVHFKGTGSSIQCEMADYDVGPRLSVHTGRASFEMTEADFEGFVSSMRHLFALERKVQTAADNGVRGAEPAVQAPNVTPIARAIPRQGGAFAPDQEPA